MNIGTVREVKNNENRVGLVPDGVKELVSRGHVVFVQETAGIRSGYSDHDYQDAGAQIVRDAEDVATEVDILVKVKEPLREEYYILDLLQNKTLFTYFHLTGIEKSVTKRLIENEITSVAYETVEDEHGKLPLLAPMSEIAGVTSVQYAAQYLQKKYGGAGLTLGHITGADLAHTVVIGGGVAGEFAARTALGMGGYVTIFELRDERIHELRTLFDELFGPHISKNFEVLKPDQPVYDEKIAEADVLVGSVLVAGARAPEVVTEDQVRSMKQGAVIVDISIDQGGCIWGSRPTSHEEPIYTIDRKIYSCVCNIPGQAARQSTQALTSTVLPYLLAMAGKGVEASLKESLQNGDGFAKGLNTYGGKIVYEAVARDLNLMDFYEDPKVMLGV